MASLRTKLSGATGALIALAAALTPGSAGAEVRLTTGPGSSYRIQLMSWAEIPFRSVVRQQYDFSCGSAAVATLLSYQYDRRTPEADVFGAMWQSGDQPTIRKFGFSMLDIKHYLESIGFKADGFRLSIDQLRQINRPGIVILDLNGYKHFVVVKGISKDDILFGDPMLGLTRFSVADFKSHWNGIFLAIVEDPRKQAPRFNLDSDWRPWSSAPVEDGMTPANISRVSDYLPPIYQITPLVLRGVNTGNQ